MDMTTLNLGGALALGQRIVISVDGTIKVLEEGQPLQTGDVILESQDGTNEPQVSIKRFSSEDGEVELDQDIANIFAALEEGQDPTELGEEFATAAGQNGSSLGNSGTIKRDGEETIPGTEFVTTGFESLGLSRTQSLSLLDAYRSLIEPAVAQPNTNPLFVDSNNDAIGDTVSFITDEDTPVSGTLSASDEDGDSLSFSKSTEPSNGTVVIDENGDWTYTPNENYNGNDSFTVEVSDGQGGIDTITVNIGVTPINDLPVGEDVSVTTDEDTPVNGSLNATDTDNDQLTFSKGTEPSNGSVVVDENGNWTYTPDENYNGSDSFTVVVDDGQGGTDTITVDVGVVSSNDAPDVDSNSITVAEESTNTSLGLSAPTDADGDSLTITVTGLPSLGTVTLADGTALTNGMTLTTTELEGLEYDAPADYNGTDAVGSFTYSVDDGQGEANSVQTGSVSIGVTEINDAPDVDSNSITVAEESTNTSLGLSAPTDADGDSLTITVTGLPSLGTVTLADGTALTNGMTLTTTELEGLEYDAPADYNGTDAVGSFTYSVDDGQGEANSVQTGSVSIGVTEINDAPVVKDFTENTIDCATSVDFAPHTSDEEDDAAGIETSVIVESDPIWGTLYEVADDGTKTEVVVGQEYGDTDNFEYVVDSNVAEQLSFSAADLASSIDTSNGSTSISYFNDMITISAGTYTGNSPVGTDVVTNPGVYLNYDGAGVEDGFGVSTNKNGNGELDVTSKDFISVDFSDSGAEIVSANLEFGSVFGNYNANSGADGEINVVALDAFGNVVGTFNFNTENASDFGNEYTLSIDGSGNAIVNVTIPDGNGGFVPFTELRVFTTQNGSVNPNINSNITFKGVDVVDAKVTETIDYKAEDSTDLESDPAQVTIVIDSIVTPSPIVTDISRDFSEDTGTAQTVTGNIDVQYADEIILQAPSENYTSGGQDITWSSSNEGQTLIGSANGSAIITAVIDDAGNYSVIFDGPIDHLDGNTTLDEMTVDIGVVATNDAGTETGSISLVIDDDVPLAQPIINDLQPSAKAGANVQLILDVSGSMAWDSVTGQSSITNESRLSIMQDAAKQLLAEYQSLGVTQVQIVTFSGSSDAQNGASGTSWMSVNEAIDLIDNLAAGGGTYYDNALDAAMDHWDDQGKVDGNPSNLTYFLSDGAPNSSGTISSTEKAEWETFVESKDITALAYGMGEAVPIGYLEDIAYNGATDSEIGAVVVPDITQLPPVILQSVIDPISGEVVNDGSNGSISGFGADGGYVSQVIYGGVTVSYDGSTVSVSGIESGVSTAIDGSEISIFIDNSHTLVLNMASGSYQFFAAVVDSDISLGFNYELSDLDHDTSSSTLTFNISAPILDANNDSATTEEFIPILVDVLANDYNPHALTSELTLSDVSLMNPSQGTVSIIDGKVLFIPDASLNSGDVVQVSYTAVDVNGNSDTAIVDITIADNSGNVISVEGDNNDAVYMSGVTPSISVQFGSTVTLNGMSYGFGVWTFPAAAMLADAIVTYGGNDHVEAGIGNDVIWLGDSGSNDTFVQSTATAFVEGSIGYVYQGASEDGDLKSPYSAPNWADVAQGASGNDFIFGESGIDLISGGSGNDYLDGGSDNDYIRAGSGDDIVIGGSGNDHLRGESGDDILIGGLGNDILTGDEGDDLFKWVDQPFQGDVDTITDFALGEDHLDISQLLPTENNMSDLLEHIAIEKVDNGGGDKDLVITISEGANNSGQTQTIVLDNTGNQFDSVNAQGDGSVISSDLSNLVNQLFVNLPDQ
ncbi:Ig-like domain-containing protein [Vibrio splendidus]|uniref:Ig-like domain-containing protein n=1 Tax=Vibrio splendidus TaxID=29497 RepID=UPI00076A4064|nr:Ig-like domain-containing protein [Vibrio splendidus]